MIAEASAVRDDRNEFTPARRLAPWVMDCVVVCPTVTILVLILTEFAWEPVVQVSSALTVLVVDQIDGLRTSPGYIAEAFSLFLAALIGALPPAVAMGASQWRGIDKAASIAALFPVWLAIVLAPAGVIFQYALSVDPTLHRAHLAANFIFLFSACATAVALAYTMWVRHHPDAFIRNRALPKRVAKRFATGSSSRDQNSMASA